MRFIAALALALAAVAFTAGSALGGAPPGHGYLVTAWATTGSPSPVVEILDGAGHVQRVVAQAGYSNSEGARWSPDGSMIAWIGHDGLSAERADGSGQRLLVPASTGCHQSCTDFSFAWSPDSRSLAVGGAGLQTNRLLVVSASTGASIDLAPATAFTNSTVVGWTPGGRSLVYERSSGDLGHAGCCRLDLRVAAPDGSRTRVVYRFPDPFSKGGGPSLSPDGRTVAFMTPSDDGGRDLIRLIDLRTGTTHDIGGFGTPMTQLPAWSRDSRRLAIARLGRKVATVDVESGHLRTLGIRGGGTYWGRTGGILILRGGNSEQVWASRDGKPARLLFRVPGGLGVATIDVR